MARTYRTRTIKQMITRFGKAEPRTGLMTNFKAIKKSRRFIAKKARELGFSIEAMRIEFLRNRSA